MNTSKEHARLQDHRRRKANWKKWGPYLSDRAWGTVREDYSADGSAWDYFPHDHARSRAYRWGEDGIGGISDRNQYICFALALWNGKDPILKERFFGLSGSEGNHGEDVKEYYFYLDSTPTHSYMQMLYKYPQAEYPYADLVSENRRRDFSAYEYELLDTDVFEGNRYFDVQIEYAKADQDNILVKITVTNRGPEKARCVALPNLWFRNTWSWGYENGPMNDVAGKPHLIQKKNASNVAMVAIKHPAAGDYYLYAENADDLLFTENETNLERWDHSPNGNPFVKDAFHRYLVNGEKDAVNPDREGTKVAMIYDREIDPGQSRTIRLRLANTQIETPFADFDVIFAQRQGEADEFFQAIQKPGLGEDEQRVQRQALAGMLWTKQFFYYNIEQWLQGDPGLPPVMEARRSGRNSEWEHLNNFDIISMPDKWEYPWYAAWDLAFHCLPLALVDADFAKRQLDLMAREWYMHPNGALPAYEWKFGDVNPPVHAWAAWRVYKIDAKQQGTADRAFLEGIFHKLLLNFTWWVNKKDAGGNNVFQGGFLGLDNISVFDRSAPLPTGGHTVPLKVRSLVGLMPLLAVETLEHDLVNSLPDFRRRLNWFFENRAYLRDSGNLACVKAPGEESRRLLSIVNRERLIKTLQPMLAENEFLSPYGIRSVSKFHQGNPYNFYVDGQAHTISYQPAESESGLFGGNSNWRGPIWFPINYLLIESLQKFHHYYGDTLKVECPTGSGRMLNLGEVAAELSRRLIKMFLRNGDGERPIYGGLSVFQDEPHWRDHILFYEYFHGDNGAGLGASHQTGWTGLVAKLIQQSGGRAV